MNGSCPVSGKIQNESGTSWARNWKSAQGLKETYGKDSKSNLKGFPLAKYGISWYQNK